MTNSLFREYRFKFYLNANHYIIIDGNKGQTHPHTWEFTVDILVDNQAFIQFNRFEKGIEEYFEKYQKRIINEISPFDHIVPTLEHMADYFAQDIRELVRDLGGLLTKMESSETPTRSYIISFEREQGFIQNVRKNAENKMDEIIDTMLDNVLS